MEQQQFIEVLKTMLTELSGAEVTEDTKPKDVLQPRLKESFAGGILFALGRNGHAEVAKKNVLPRTWASKTIKELAVHFIPVLMFLFLGLPAMSQFTISIGAAKTDLGQGAVTFLAGYAPRQDSIWKNQNNFLTGKNSFTLYYPEFIVQGGTADAFSSISLKVTGLHAIFRTKSAGRVTKVINGQKVTEDIVIPDFSKVFHAIPFSAGVETNQQFNYVNGIIETGWRPEFGTGPRARTLLGAIETGVYLQGGYKFYVDSTQGIGGKADETLEDPRSGILRARGHFGINTRTLIQFGGIKAGIVGDANAWYDFLNKKVYHSVLGSARFYFTDDNFIDLYYRNGAGMPTGNTGQQFGVQGTVTL